MKKLAFGSAILMAVTTMAMALKAIIKERNESKRDLKSIMDRVKEINKQKNGLRKIQDQINKLACAVAG